MSLDDAKPGTRSFRSALSLVTFASLLSPMAGLLVAPILAHAFAPGDRGLIAAAIAPSTLVLSIAALGLPDALTYYIARNPSQVRRLLTAAAAGTFLLGIALFAAVLALGPALTAGDRKLQPLMELATALALPALVVNVARGAAIGLHRWRTVAIEKVAYATIRIGLFLGFFFTNTLTLTVAVAISMLPAVAVGLVYAFLLRKRTTAELQDDELDQTSPRIFGMYGFAVRAWVGTVASVLIARVDQILMVPLSNSVELGIYSVSITVAELPLIIVLAAQSALFGFASRDKNPAQLSQAARGLFWACLALVIAICGSLPLWITIVFGDNYRAATTPTILLLVATVCSVPAICGGTALASEGRPGLRSTCLVGALTVNVLLLIMLVPPLGALGACIGSIATSIFHSVLILAMLRSKCKGRGYSLIWPTSADIKALITTVRQLMILRVRSGKANVE